MTAGKIPFTKQGQRGPMERLGIPAREGSTEPPRLIEREEVSIAIPRRGPVSGNFRHTKDIATVLEEAELPRNCLRAPRRRLSVNI